MFVWVCALLLILTSTCRAQCIDGDGNFVDWFVMMKMNNGYHYLYADESSETLVEEKFRELTDSDNPVGRVLERVYNTDSYNYLLYNDQPPNLPMSNRGHTKGIVTWDDNWVTWILHSAPNFPPQKELGYSYPSSAETYGQSFLCLSFSVKQLQDVVEQLYYTWPKIYEYQVADKFVQEISKMELILRGRHIKEAPWKSIKTFQTPGSTIFKSFAKSAEFGDDLYKTLISPYFKTDLYTETWQNGAGKLPSNCTGEHSVKNIVSIDLLGNVYKETQDHSKWCISRTGSVLCVGGINRMKSQTTRGGGTMCFVTEKLWTQLSDGIQEIEECEGFHSPKYLDW